MSLIIAPSLLASDFSRLSEEIASVERGGAEWLHLDIMDGRFVPNISFGPPVISSIRTKTKLPFDTHLMIEEPERYIEEFRNAGADLITIHVEACLHLHRTLARIRELGALAGVAVNPSTPVSDLEPVLGMVDLVLIMTVNPGFGGQSFIPETLQKVERARELTASLPQPPLIEVDGGIDIKTARRCVDAGASVLVAGTSIFRTDDPARAIRTLRESARGGG